MASAKKEQEKNPWPKRIQAWEKFSRKFHERGSQIEARYQDDREAEANMVPSTMSAGVKKVNLFYSNTTVIKESLYNSLPKPSVSRLHKGEYENEPARIAALIMERGLSYEVHCAKWFDTAVKAAILDRLVPGLGITWVTFNPPEPAKQIPESMSVDIVYWKDFIYEPKRAWEQVTWAGRILHMTTEEAQDKWGDKALSTAPKEGSTSGAMSTTTQMIEEGKVCIVQMWDKTKKEVLHMTMTGEVLDRIRDPYELIDFYPCPKPMLASPPTAKFLPLADYYIAQDQYMEMDILYARINLIIEAVKVAGVYDSSSPEIGRMLSGAENKLIPVDNWAVFAEKGGVKGVIDWYPIETITAVLNSLVSTYEFMKNQLFEVTGMADIVRGSTNQYETASAQKIKAQFASVRMNAYQRDVSFFVRDLLHIMGEIMVQMYSDEKLSQVCGQLPQPDQPHVQEALAILRSDFMLKYSIDIETDSLTQADWGLEQQSRMEFVQSLSQFIQSAIPAMQQTPAIGPLMLEIIKFATVGFKGSSELEGAIDAALTAAQAEAQKAAQQPPQPSPEEQKAKAEQAAMQAQLQMDQQREQNKMQIEQQRAQAQAVLEQQKRDAELAYLDKKNVMELAFQAQKNAAELQFLKDKAAIEANVAVQKGQQEIERNAVKDAQKMARGIVLPEEIGEENNEQE